MKILEKMNYKIPKIQIGNDINYENEIAQTNDLQKESEIEMVINAISTMKRKLKRLKIDNA